MNYDEARADDAMRFGSFIQAASGCYFRLERTTARDLPRSPAEWFDTSDP